MSSIIDLLCDYFLHRQNKNWIYVGYPFQKLYSSQKDYSIRSGY